jgi:hypothetical protein
MWVLCWVFYVGGWIREVLYYLSHSTSLFCTGYFWDGGVSLDALDHNHPICVFMCSRNDRVCILSPTIGWDGVLWNFSLDWPRSAVLPKSASQVASIIGLSHHVKIVAYFWLLALPCPSYPVSPWILSLLPPVSFWICAVLSVLLTSTIIQAAILTWVTQLIPQHNWSSASALVLVFSQHWTFECMNIQIIKIWLLFLQDV